MKSDKNLFKVRRWISRSW